MTSPNDREFGILTCAAPNDYLKAIGLALSVRVSNPGVPIAIACSPKLRPLLAPHFDVVVDEATGIRGFEHKVHLDRYTPFKTTMFFDSDVLIFKPVRPFAEAWGNYAFRACGHYRSDGFSSFGMDRAAALRRLGKDQLVVIDGAGHSLFRLPESGPVWDRAREITAHHNEYFGKIQYADEDVLNYVMTEFDLPPAPIGEFFSRYLSAVPGTLKMNAAEGLCTFTRVDNGQPQSPCMMHFAANEAPFPYHRQLRLLYRKFGVDPSGLWRSAWDDYYATKIHAPLHRIKFNTMKRLGLNR